MSAILAQQAARGMLGAGQDLTNASITGEAFRGRVEGRSLLGEVEAVDTSIEGSAFVTGYQTFVLDERDPLGNGFRLS
jgi:4-hydroxyproline epimerase